MLVARPLNLMAMLDRPGMYVTDPTLETVIAFIAGYDLSSDGSASTGLREWLLPQVGDGTSLSWATLMSRFVKSRTNRPARRGVSAATHQVQVLKETLNEFWRLRDEPDGLQGIYRNFALWQQDRSGARQESAKAKSHSG